MSFTRKAGVAFLKCSPTARIPLTLTGTASSLWKRSFATSRAKTRFGSRRGAKSRGGCSNYSEMDLASFYPEAPNSDRIYELGIGLGGEEAIRKAFSYRND